MLPLEYYFPINILYTQPISVYAPSSVLTKTFFSWNKISELEWKSYPHYSLMRDFRFLILKLLKLSIVANLSPHLSQVKDINAKVMIYNGADVNNSDNLFSR